MPSHPPSRVVQPFRPPEGVKAVDHLWLGRDLPADDLRALAVGAWEAAEWSAFHDTVELVPGRAGASSSPKEGAIDALLDGWSVAGEQDAHRTITRLHDGMHAPIYGAVHPLVMEAITTDAGMSMGERDGMRERHGTFLADLASMNDIPRHHYVEYYRTWTQALKLDVCPDLPRPLPDDIHAWDLTRAVWVIRASVTAGYLTEEEAWPLLRRGLTRSRARYANWRQFAHSALTGLAFWHSHEDLATTKDRVYREIHRFGQLWHQPLSPWRRFELHPDVPALTLTAMHDLG